MSVLLEALRTAQEAGEAKQVEVYRCADHRSRVRTIYEVRGQQIELLGGIKLSPRRAAELGLPREISPRAFPFPAPAGEWAGCRHGCIEKLGGRVVARGRIGVIRAREERV